METVISLLREYWPWIVFFLVPNVLYALTQHPALSTGAKKWIVWLLGLLSILTSRNATCWGKIKPPLWIEKAPEAGVPNED